MPTSIDDIDRFQNSLTGVLGADTLIILSANQKDRHFLGAEVLQTFATYLLIAFATAFAEELKQRLADEFKKAGKWLANEVLDRLKSYATTIKPFEAGSPENRKNAVVTADTSIRDLATYEAAKASLEEATRAAKAKVEAELKANGFSDKEASKKADEFVQTIMSRVPK